MGSKDHSFDIVSEVDLQEVTNAVEQSKKEIGQRYDFKDSKSLIEWNKAERTITLQTESEFRLKALIDVLQGRFARRNVSLKAMEPGTVEKATGGNARQTIRIRQGISMEKAREIVKFIKDLKLKVQAQIQNEQVRVQAVKIDVLQTAIQELKKKDFGIDLDYVNYR